VVVLGAFLSGCIPFTVVDTVNYDIRVVDKSTNAPIGGATVRVFAEKTQILSTQTGADGTAHILSKSHDEWLPPLPFDIAYFPPRFQIAADGSAAVDIAGGDKVFEREPYPDGEQFDLMKVRYHGTVALSPIASTRPDHPL
jgi:hypothetical protein